MTRNPARRAVGRGTPIPATARAEPKPCLAGHKLDPDLCKLSGRVALSAVSSSA